MKRNLISKGVSSILIIISIIALKPIGVSAFDGQGSTNKMTIANESTIYADSYQWDYRKGGWICGTPDLNQGYANAWICTNGKWYYVNKYGWMVSNTWVNNYYLDNTGAWTKTR